MRRGLVLRVKKRPAGRHGAAMGVREVCGSWTGAAFGGLSSAELRRHALASCSPQLDWCSGWPGHGSAPDPVNSSGPNRTKIKNL
jgi:hypothetical protein